MSIARRNAFFARPVLISASSAKPSTVCTRASSGASFARPLRRPPRPVATALHQPQFREPRPGQRVLRLVLHRLLERLPRRLDAEPRLLGIGQGDPGGGRLRTQLDRASGIFQRPLPVVLRHGDHRAQRVGAAVARIAQRAWPMSARASSTRPTDSSVAAR